MVTLSYSSISVKQVVDVWTLLLLLLLLLLMTGWWSNLIFFVQCHVVFVRSETFLRPPTESAFSQ